MRSREGQTRVLQVVGKGMYRHGVETWLMHVLRHIDRERFHMDFVVEATEKCAYDDEIEALGSRIFRGLNHRHLLTYGHAFRRILRDQGPYDVVHSHFHEFSGYVLRLAHQGGVPIRIAHSHNDYSQITRKTGVVWRAYINLTRRWLVRHATVGLAVSPKAASSLFGRGWEADPRWQVLYCGIDLQPFRATVDPACVRAEIGIPAGALVVGHVGRFREQKNHSFLVDIAVEVAKREPRMHLLLIGDGPLRPAIERQAKKADVGEKIIFAGVRSDVPRLMLGAMNVFVLPSLYEGLGIVGIEAQAAGLPFILSDVVPEEIDVVDPLVRRLSLSQPASAWAEEIVAMKRSPPPVAQQDAVDLVREGGFDIASNLSNLEATYTGQFSTFA